MNISNNKLADAIRILSIDTVTNAKSGHPGMPLGASQIIFAIFKYHLRFDPKDPKWFFRERFVLSSGHASAMLYSTLYLFGYDIKIEDLKSFRKIGSITPGHPEYSHTPGVEATTGPLGQGVAMSVGMAWSSRYLSNLFNKKDMELFDDYVYALCGDGDMMEGITYESASLAGNLNLDNLIWIYDSNNITIEGKTDMAFRENVKDRFISQGWNVLVVENGFDISEINKAISLAKEKKGKPNLIIVKTKIGYKSPKEGSNKVHGEPLSDEEVDITRKNLGWEYSERFFIPEEIKNEFKKIYEYKITQRKEIDKKIEKYKSEYPEDWERFSKYLNGEFDFKADLDESKPYATRESSHIILNRISERVENIVSGSADLAPSTKTDIKNYPERNIHFGIREHAMGGFVNGVSLYGALRPVCSTFLVFSDYLRPAIRLSALMGTNPVFVFTHDSIGVGEDGPTHQPVEHLMSLRLIPNLYVIRPCDFYETLSAWNFILKNNIPSALLLTRQKVNTLTAYKDLITDNFKKGAYNIVKYDKPDVVLISSGSEVHIALSVCEKLNKEGIKANVVSVPCVELALKNSKDYLLEIFPPGVKKAVIEAAVGIGWSDIIKDNVHFFGVDSFGYSGTEKDVYDKFALNADSIYKKIKEIL